MAGLVPGIHVLLIMTRKKDVDARDKRGHDELERKLQFAVCNPPSSFRDAPLGAGPESISPVLEGGC
jgi:hypothetical protein